MSRLEPIFVWITLSLAFVVGIVIIAMTAGFLFGLFFRFAKLAFLLTGA